jgi:hypothetical protein
MVGLAMIIGAYIMGLSLSRTDLVQVIQKEVEGLHNILVPVFFATMGMMVDLGAIHAVLKVGVVYSLLAVASKVLGCGIPALFCGFNRHGAARIGVGMLPRGEVALIVAGIGLTSGAIGQDIFGIAILMTLVTTLLGPLLLAGSFENPASGLRKPEDAAKSESKEIVLSFPSPTWPTSCAPASSAPSARKNSTSTASPPTPPPTTSARTRCSSPSNARATPSSCASPPNTKPSPASSSPRKCSPCAACSTWPRKTPTSTPWNTISSPASSAATRRTPMTPRSVPFRGSCARRAPLPPPSPSAPAPNRPPPPLRKGDALLVRIEGLGGGLPEYREIVDSDGNIELPFLGFLPADGKTIRRLEAEMAAAYATARLATNAAVQITSSPISTPPRPRDPRPRPKDPRRPVPAADIPPARAP